jgi:hypothetical protein
VSEMLLSVAHDRLSTQDIQEISNQLLGGALGRALPLLGTRTKIGNKGVMKPRHLSQLKSSKFTLLVLIPILLSHVPLLLLLEEERPFRAQFS